MNPNQNLIDHTDFGWTEVICMITTNTSTTIHYWVTTRPINEMFEILEDAIKRMDNGFLNGNGGGYDITTGALAGTHVFRYQQITDLKDHCKWFEFLNWWKNAGIWKRPMNYEGECDLYEYFQAWLKDNYGFNNL